MADDYNIEATFSARVILETNNKSVAKAKKQVAEYLERFLNDVEITLLEVKSARDIYAPCREEY